MEDLRGSELLSIQVISTPVSMSVPIYPYRLSAITGGKRAQLGKLTHGNLAQAGFLSARKLSANRLCTCKLVCYFKLFTVTVCKQISDAGKQVNNSWQQQFNNLLSRLCARCPQLRGSVCAL